MVHIARRRRRDGRRQPLGTRARITPRGRPSAEREQAESPCLPWADIEWNVPAVLPHGAKARGPEEVGRFFEVLASTWENFDLQLDDFVASGDRVCAIGSAHGTLRGKHTGYGFVHAWTVRDGALARLDEYVDPEPELYAG